MREDERKEEMCGACFIDKHQALSPLMGAPKQLATPTAAATTSISAAALCWKTKNLKCYCI